MNDEEFFQLLNQFPIRNDQENIQSQSRSQPTNIFSIFNNLMGGLNRNPTTTTSNVNKEEEEFWQKLKSFLNRNINSQEEADIIYNNFRNHHENYLKQQ